jgi:hypothetical protein
VPRQQRREVGGGGHARQRLAAEAEREHAAEVVGDAQLAGGVALDRHRQLRGGDAVTVVGDADQGDAAALDLDRDRGRAGVERVLDQFLDGGRGPLDHLAGGDLGGNQRRQDLDRHRPATSLLGDHGSARVSRMPARPGRR